MWHNSSESLKSWSIALRDSKDNLVAKGKKEGSRLVAEIGIFSLM